ncbi:MAG TPA: hypothetical protein VN625_09810 [Desulfuromonadaceae bacterium]|nr:hypothetical protein [Desulfuromonadaceae bacterium]
MKREKADLIHDVLSEGRRDDILAAGTKILRRRRQWRIAGQTAAVAALVAVLWFAVQPGRPPEQVQASIAKSPAQAQAKALTDQELLALFPDTPVGLAKLPDGKKILIFPRPGDEQRFVTRL